MTNQQLDAFLELLTAKGWTVELSNSDEVRLNETLIQRYPRIPDDYLKFLERVALCVNSDKTVWFMCADDYNGTTRSPFAWNEFELIDLGGCNEQESEQVRKFWDRYLPFMLSVKGNYACLSLCMSEEDYGSVVDSHAPDVNGMSRVAANFDEFVRFFTAALERNFSKIPPEYL